MDQQIRDEMKIAVYKDNLSTGREADVAVRNLAEGLRTRGHDAVAFTKPELAVRLAENWDAVISTGTNELLDLEGYRKAPIIQQFHTRPESQFKWKRVWRNLKIKRALKKVAAIQVLRSTYVEQVEKYGPHVEVIGNWSAYESEALKAPAEERKIILYPAAFSKSKNHSLLLKSFARLHDDFPDWTLKLYGNGFLSEKLPPNVMVKPYGDLHTAYEECAFLAFPSVDEGFPLTVAEAASFAKPAVMVQDWIGTGTASGAIVTASSVEGYANGLRRMMQDASARRRMGENARCFCSLNYSRAHILDRWEQLLKLAVSGCYVT